MRCSNCNTANKHCNIVPVTPSAKSDFFFTAEAKVTISWSNQTQVSNSMKFRNLPSLSIAVHATFVSG